MTKAKKAPVKGAKLIKIRTNLTPDQVLQAMLNTPPKKKKN